MKLLIVLLNATLVFSWKFGEKNGAQYQVVYNDEDGSPEIVDTWAPLPEPMVSTSQITLYLYTRKNPSNAQILPLDAQAVASASNFNSKRKNVFLIHGWTNTWQSDCNVFVKDAYLKALDVNVFVVDWSKPAGGTYGTAFANVPTVGRFIGEFLTSFQYLTKLGATDFVLVGYSLGGHVAGCAGAANNGNIGVIVGLDSAGPGFINSIISNRLDPTDAHYVQAIHTSGGLLGYNDNLGHKDVRPNGGSSQPGCGLDLAGSCSHSRAYQYFSESVASGGFTTWLCESHNEFESGKCSRNAKSHMGGKNIDTRARGDYYLTTHSDSPYSQA